MSSTNHTSSFITHLTYYLNKNNIVINKKKTFIKYNNFYIPHKSLNECLDIVLSIVCENNLVDDQTFTDYERIEALQFPNIIKNFIISLDTGIIALGDKLYSIKDKDYINALPNKKINFCNIRNTLLTGEYTMGSIINDPHVLDCLYFVIGNIINNKLSYTKPILIYANHEILISLNKCLVELCVFFNINCNLLYSDDTFIKNNIYLIDTIPRDYNVILNTFFIDISSIVLSKVARIRLLSDDIIVANKTTKQPNIVVSLHVMTLNPIYQFIKQKCVECDDLSISKTSFKRVFKEYYDSRNPNYSNYTELLAFTLNWMGITSNLNSIFGLSFVNTTKIYI